MYFFHFSDTCYLGFNGSTKFLESTTAMNKENLQIVTDEPAKIGKSRLK
jgi:hypothetical protein